ncbi:NAD(P)-binding protein [Xylariaceae sp. FL0594]|nr:NAD(P)-binding protein [Xylariaceae sp. FL0594]
MATRLSLAGGTALVTGAAAGIGKETAFALAEAGVEGIVFADIDGKGAQNAAEESSSRYAKHPAYRAVAVKVDARDETSVRNMVDVAVKEFGRIDYSVNSAGMGNISGEMTPNVEAEVFRQTLETNITGTLLCIRAVAAVMAKQNPLQYNDTNTSGRGGGDGARSRSRSLGRGCIVNLGSVNSYTAVPGMLSYTTSKHALIGLTKSAAIDCLKDHIRVNAVCPSYVDTPMMARALDRVPGLGDMIKQFSPLGRAATADEVADYVVFLCSPFASYINGTGLVVDAGATLTAHAG